jgi:Na+/H+ antiporter NhaD/arsenite permease-like protein
LVAAAVLLFKRQTIGGSALQTPLLAVIPFVLYLLLIATLPLFLGRFWESNRNKLALALIAGAPVIFYLLRYQAHGGEMLFEAGRDYVAFMCLLGALFVISGGIYLRGALAATPLTNTAVMAVGAVLASFIGTTGASALLIRPLLRANERRQHARHLVVFFIFIVANSGGLLTPLGDPPLFLGFLRGVPFTWTLRLVGPWAFVNGVLLAVFYVFDRLYAKRETSALPTPETPEPFKIEGRINGLWLLGVIGTVFLAGVGGFAPGMRALVQIVGMVLFAGLSLKTTPARIHEANRFNWGPIHEVGVVFVGVFITMIPALSFLGERGASLGVTQPWHFFWASGALSSVLDNAPTYLTFASLATGVADAGAGLLSVTDLGALASHGVGQHLLRAVSCGSVCMGAITYIGNGPNFMVKAIAEQHHVRMPSFFGYVAWSFAILVPLFGLVSLVFFG